MWTMLLGHNYLPNKQYKAVVGGDQIMDHPECLMTLEHWLFLFPTILEIYPFFTALLASKEINRLQTVIYIYGQWYPMPAQILYPLPDMISELLTGKTNNNAKSRMKSWAKTTSLPSPWYPRVMPFPLGYWSSKRSSAFEPAYQRLDNAFSCPRRSQVLTAKDNLEPSSKDIKHESFTRSDEVPNDDHNSLRMRAKHRSRDSRLKSQ